jgi:hypothetical protein
MKYKIISCRYAEAEAKIQPLLDEGWTIKQITNENVGSSLTDYGFGEPTSIRGLIIFLLERSE